MLFLDLRKRLNSSELMDTQRYPLPVMRDVLRFLEQTNRFFGGTKLVLGYLEQWSKRWPANQTIRILDVGTGAADIPRAILEWAKEKKKTVWVHAIDIVPEIVDIAWNKNKHVPNLLIEEKNVFDLAKANQTYDYVISSLFLHHIPMGKEVHYLQTFDELATRGLLMSDLNRSRASYLSIKILSLLIGNSVVIYDAPLSVRRAYHHSELPTLIAKASLPYLKANKEPWFRLSLAGEKV